MAIEHYITTTRGRAPVQKQRGSIKIDRYFNLVLVHRAARFIHPAAVLIHWTGRQIEMAGRYRAASAAAPLPSKPPIVMDNGHFSDSASSLDGGSDESSRLYAAGAAAAPGAAGSSASPAIRGSGGGGGGGGGGDGGRRRRSGGIPSLISKHGSRSNLGVENGISRAHEISRYVHAEKGRRARRRKRKR